MKTLTTSTLFVALLLFAACGDESASNSGTNNNTPAPNTTPELPVAPEPPATEIVFLDVSGMT